MAEQQLVQIKICSFPNREPGQDRLFGRFTSHSLLLWTLYLYHLSNLSPRYLYQCRDGRCEPSLLLLPVTLSESGHAIPSDSLSPLRSRRACRISMSGGLVKKLLDPLQWSSMFPPSSTRQKVSLIVVSRSFPPRTMHAPSWLSPFARMASDFPPSVIPPLRRHFDVLHVPGYRDPAPI